MSQLLPTLHLLHVVRQLKPMWLKQVVVLQTVVQLVTVVIWDIMVDIIIQHGIQAMVMAMAPIIRVGIKIKSPRLSGDFFSSNLASQCQHIAFSMMHNCMSSTA